MSAATNWEDAYRVQVESIKELRSENADLRGTLDAVIAADGRAVDLWRAAHPGKELVIPDRAKLVGWLLEKNAALREDKARLDWFINLEEEDRVKFCRGWHRWTPEQVRAEIDEELRKEAQP